MGKLRNMLKQARKGVAYWSEHAVLDFTDAIERLMREQDVSRAELGRRIDTSQAYVTKVLSGESNFTVKSMVQLAHALDASIRIEVVRNADRQRQEYANWQSRSFHSTLRAVPHVTYRAAANDAWQTEKAA